MARFEVSTNIGDPIEGSAQATGRGGETYGQRRFQLWVGRECISVFVYGDDETRALMKALASASGGLLATLPDEPGPLGERDESAVAVEQERWPSVAEVAGEVHGGVSCGYSGCTPADPCGACQTLAGAQGAGTQGGER